MNSNSLTLNDNRIIYFLDGNRIFCFPPPDIVKDCKQKRIYHHSLLENAVLPNLQKCKDFVLEKKNNVKILNFWAGFESEQATNFKSSGRIFTYSFT